MNRKQKIDTLYIPIFGKTKNKTTITTHTSSIKSRHDPYTGVDHVSAAEDVKQEEAFNWLRAGDEFKKTRQVRKENIPSIYQDILNKYSKIYRELDNVKVKARDMSHSNFQGYCYSHPVGEFTIEGKIRYKRVVTDYIILDISNPDKAQIMFTFLHEMSHAITPYCERKVKNQWIRLDHSHKFYESFRQIMEIAFAQGIVDKQYTISDLKRKDEMKLQYNSDMKQFGK